MGTGVRGQGGRSGWAGVDNGSSGRLVLISGECVCVWGGIV